MSNDRFLLTLAIPTYNRAEYLGELLNALLGELKGEGRVELLVSDNASSDSTRETIARLQRQGLDVRYLRNENNLGADRNILQCYLKAAGKYVWIFSDDDLVLPGTISRVLAALSLGTYDVLSLTACSYESRPESGSQEAPPRKDRVFVRAKDLANSVHVFFTFISGIIVNKDRVSALPHRPFESLLDTNLVQLGPYYSALNHHRRSLLIRDPLIAARSNSNVGYGLYSVFGTKFSRITREWIDDPNVSDAIINGTLRTFFPSWVMKSREATASRVPENPHQVLRICYGTNMRYWWFDYPIYVLPLPLAKLWLLGVRIVNKAHSVFGGLLQQV